MVGKGSADMGMHILNFIRPGRFHCCAPNRGQTAGTVGAGIRSAEDLHRGDFSVPFCTNFIAETERMPLGALHHTFFARPCHFARPIGRQRHHCRACRHDDDIDILSAKGTADRRLNHPHAALRQAAGARQIILDIIGEFAGHINRYPAMLRHDNSHIRLNRRMLDALGLIFPLQDHIRLRKALFHIPLADDMLTGQIAVPMQGHAVRLQRQIGVEDSRQHLIFYPHLFGRRPRLLQGFRSYHCHTVPGRTDDLIGQHGLIRGLLVFPGNIRGSVNACHTRHALCLFHIYGQNPRMCMRSMHGHRI